MDVVDVRDMTQKEVRSRLGYVPQKGVLFSGTIDSNIRYGKTDISEAEVKEAAEVAQATEFIETKPEKYTSPIAQGGPNVAGGQKQRLSILNADKIIVLDDGHMAGIGSHKELMKNCEVYRQIAMSQLSEEELA